MQVIICQNIPKKHSDTWLEYGVNHSVFMLGIMQNIYRYSKHFVVQCQTDHFGTLTRFNVRQTILVL